jgi:ATP-dependent helicase/nuclease subunit A
MQRFQADPDAGKRASGSERSGLCYRLEELKRELLVGDPPRPVRWKDMAVLARTAGIICELEAALAARGIPCAVRRGRNFFDEQEVVDFTNLLRFWPSPGDEIALYALLRSPFFGIADQEILYSSGSGAVSARGGGAGAGAAAGGARSEPPDRMIARFLDERGYLQNRRPARLCGPMHKFLRCCGQWHGAAPGQWRRWLATWTRCAPAGEETQRAGAG